MNLKRNRQRGVDTRLVSSRRHSPAPAKFPAEGIWRGEFTVDGDPIPFNFEVKGKDAEAREAHAAQWHAAR